MAARVSLFLAHLGFWVGSLWGDRLVDGLAGPEAGLQIAVPEWAFSIGWAGFSIASIALGSRTRGGYVATLSIVFLAIHFYTQLFETLGREPAGLMLSGAIPFVSATVWWKLRHRIEA